MSVTSDARVLTFKRVTTSKRYPNGITTTFAVNLTDVRKFEKATFQEAGYPSVLLIKIILKPGTKASNISQETGKAPISLPSVDGFNISFAPLQAALREATYKKLVGLTRH